MSYSPDRVAGLDRHAEALGAVAPARPAATPARQRPARASSAVSAWQGPRRSTRPAAARCRRPDGRAARVSATWICSALENGRHRDHDRELLRVALEVVGHGEDGAVAVAHQHHLGGLVEELGVGLGHVEAAEGEGVRRRRPAARAADERAGSGAVSRESPFFEESRFGEHGTAGSRPGVALARAAGGRGAAPGARGRASDRSSPLGR